MYIYLFYIYISSSKPLFSCVPEWVVYICVYIYVSIYVCAFFFYLLLFQNIFTCLSSDHLVRYKGVFRTQWNICDEAFCENS